MPQVRETIEIEAPPERVWDVAMNPRRLGEWVTAHRRVADAPAELDEGDSFEQVLCLGGQPIDVTWTLKNAEEPRLAEWEADGPKDSGAQVRYRLESRNGGTRFRYENDFDLPGGVLRMVAGRIAGAPARHASRSSLKRLKRVCEAESR